MSLPAGSAVSDGRPAPDRCPLPDAPAGMPMTVASLLRRSYRDYADLPAVVDGARQYTFAQLGELVARCAAGLDQLGVPPDARVVLIAQNSAEFAVIEQAIFLSGRVRVALSPRLGRHEIAGIVQDCRPALLVVDRTTMPTVAAALDSPDGPPPLLVAVDDAARTGSGEVLGFTDLLADDPAARPRIPAPADLAALLYTSGTTGKPKGAMITHSAWLAMVRNTLVELGPVIPGERLLTVAPMTHLGGYLSLCFTARGCCQVIHRQFDAAAVLEAIERGSIQHLPLVPTMIGMLVRHAQLRGGPVHAPRLRTIVYAASPIDETVLRRALELFGPVLVQFYGLSEIPMPLTCLSAVDHALSAADPALSSRLQSAGRVSPFVDLRVADRDGIERPAGAVGEVWAACDTTMLGYWNRPEATAEALERGWLRTGDLGRLDESGFLHLVGRAKDQIITGGFNVYPGEVEAVLARDERIAEVTVLGIADPIWGEVVHAAIVPAGGELDADDLDSLQATARRLLAGYKVPRSFSQHRELPRNGVGKVLRRVLQDQLSHPDNQR